MDHSDKLLKALVAAASVGFLTLLGLAIGYSILGREEIGGLAKGLATVASIAIFLSLFVLWAHWLRYFWRSGQKREFWLCYCFPYIYATYRTVAHLRTRPSGRA